MRRTFMIRAALALALAGLGTAAAQAQNFGKTLKGTVVYGGKEAPKREPLNITKDQEVCMPNGKAPLSQDWLVNDKNLGVKNVFIWLEPEPNGPPLDIAPALKDLKKKEVILDQPLCHFEPGMVALREGQILIVKNPAPINHNFRYTGHPAKNPGNNFNMIPNSELQIKDLKADTFPVTLQCDIHPWMKGFIRVFDHPYYALTDESGNFSIPEPPAGNYRLKVWHAASGWAGGAKGKAGIPIAIQAGGDTDAGKITIGP